MNKDLSLKKSELLNEYLRFFAKRVRVHARNHAQPWSYEVTQTVRIIDIDYKFNASHI